MTTNRPFDRVDIKTDFEVALQRMVFGSHDDRFSRAVSAIRNITSGFAESQEDIARYHAPSECYTLVARKAAARAKEALDQLGYATYEFTLEVLRRADHKQAYDLLDLDMLDGWEVHRAFEQWKQEQEADN